MVSSKIARNNEWKWNFKRDVWEADDAGSEAAGYVIKCLKQTAEIMYCRISNSPKNCDSCVTCSANSFNK